MTGIEGRRVLVTGGASGIGLAIARRLRERGAEVAVLDLPGSNLESAEADGFLVVAADVRSASAVKAALTDVGKRLRSLDTLVLSAGVIHINPLADVSEEDWDLTLDVNLKGAFLVTQAAAPALVSSGRGRVVAISSDAGRRGVPMLHAYSASKAGLIGLAEALASELAPHATVNCLCPVSTPETGIGQQVLAWKREVTGTSDQAVLDDITRIFPMARTGNVSDVADAAEFLISDGASFITGAALDIDGGAALNFLPGAQP